MCDRPEPLLASFFCWEKEIKNDECEKRNNKPQSRAQKLLDKHVEMRRIELTSIPNLIECKEKNGKNEEKMNEIKSIKNHLCHG